MAEELDLVSLFRGSIGKVLNFLLVCGEENSKSEIARKSDVTFKTVSDIWPILERYDIIKPTRTIGMAKLYSINNESKIVGQLKKIRAEIVNHNHKGLFQIYSVYGFLLLLTLPLLGTLYFETNNSPNFTYISNGTILNVTTIVLINATDSNMTEILSINETNVTWPLVNITTIVENTTVPDGQIIDTKIEELVYSHEPIEIGKRVLWYREIKTRGGDNYTVGLNLPLDYRDLAMIDAIGNYTLENDTLVLSGEHDIQMSFTTSLVEVSEQILSENPYEKKVSVSSQSALHYTNVGVSVSIPEKMEVTIIEMPGKEIINDPEYNVTLLDTDGNGKADALSWIVPQLSSKEYLIQETTGKKPEGITFDRGLDCNKCGQHKAPPLTDVTMTISATFSGNRTGSYLTDYFPIEWSITNPNGGIIETYNASHSKISWHYDNLTDSVSQWYVVYSPERTIPPTDYDFVSELDGQQSEPWRVVVADPFFGSPPEIVYEFFESASLANWTSTGTWATGSALNVTAAICAGGGGTAGYQNISNITSLAGYFGNNGRLNMSFTVTLNNLDAGEGFRFWYYNGSAWNNSNTTIWTTGSNQDYVAYIYYIILPNANQSTFQMRFACNVSAAATEDCNVDDIRIFGTSLVLPSLLNVTIGNVSANIYRGDTENDIFCNATSSGASVTANVSLQYNNGSVGDWINLNETNKANNVSYINTSHGSNPRVEVTVTTAGTIVPFDVYGNRTGANQFRCNVTTGPIGAPTTTNISTNAAAMTIQAPPLNTSITTVPAGPITIYNDQTNNFNLTCNVTALAGNASSVTLYVQWNSTVGAWNFTNNTGGPMRINETTPIVFSNVDNSSWATDFRTFNVTGYTTGNYSVRCYANSSDRDGPNTNGSSIVAVNVTAVVPYGWLNISYQSPATGNSQNVTRYDTFNVTMNVTCVGGDCGNITGVLRYNASAGLNPNAAVSNTTGATPFYVTENNLNDYWKLDENTGQYANDSSLNGYNGTLGSTPGVDANDPTWVQAKSGSGLLFNGVNSYLDLSAVGNAFKIQPITVELWVRANRTSASAGNLLNYENGGGYYGWWFMTDPVHPMFRWVNSGGGVIADVRSPASVNDTQWHHLVVTDNGTTMKIYVDGNLSNSSSSGTPQWAATMYSYAGALRPEGSALYWFNGTLDNIMVYNRALTAAEVSQHYTSLNANYSLNPLSCGNMSAGYTCQLSWTVNATGTIGTQYFLDANFSSTVSQANDSGNFQINITAIVDTTAPNIASFKYNVSNNTNYSSTQGYQFNATVTDVGAGISYVWVEHNFSGTLKNYSVTGNVGSVYYYNNASLAASPSGVPYYIKWYANDSSANHNLNSSDWVHYYQVNKSYLPMTLYINGTDGDKILYNNSNANFTANFSSAYSFNISLYTNLTGTMAPWDNKQSPLTNYTILNPYIARNYTILANWSGNQNYTISSVNHNLDLRTYGRLNVSYQSPATGNSQNVVQYDTFNVSVNVTCVGGDCGNIWGVLRYNNSAGLNPDTNVSTNSSAVPFYVTYLNGTGQDRLTDWNYRRSRNITYSPGAGTGYQKKIKAHYGTLDWESFLNSLNFERDTNNPLMSPNGGWEGTMNIADEDIIEEDNVLRMYYTGNPEGPTGGVGLATSPKTYPPTNWTRNASNPIYTDGADYIRLGSVIKVGSTYYLYYTGGMDYNSIRLATSTDGVTFSKVGNVIVPSGDETTVENAAVINIDATHWYMYYGYRNATATLPGIRIANSSDGLTWTKQAGDVLHIGAGGAWDNTYIEHHQIMYAYGHYVLIYEAYNGVNWAEGLAYNTDPNTTFTKYANNPIFERSGINGTFDELHVATPFLFLHNDAWYLFYQGGNHTDYMSSVWKIGLAYNSENVYLNNKSKADFGDIRFTNSSGTALLDYWMESKNDSNNAVFWVEIANNLSSQNQQIYIYYGNGGATNVSNGTNTFVFFDDFPGSSLNPQWASNQSVTVSGGQAHFTAESDTNAGSESYTITSQTFPINKCLEIYFKPLSTTTRNRMGWTVDRTTFGSGAWNLIGTQFYTNDYVYTNTNNGSAAPIQVTRATYPATWQKLSIKWFPGNVTYCKDRISLWGGQSSQVPSGSDMKILMRDKMDVDWIFVRNAINLEPNGLEWGSETSIKSNPSPCGSMLMGQTCQLNWSVNATGTPGTQYQLDANFTSSYSQVPANDSGDFQINITSAAPSYGWLNVSYQSPANGSSQNVTRYDTFNVTMNVTCVGGDCGNITGVLRYNASAILNPDTNVSTVFGTTPFYALTSVLETNISNEPGDVNSVAIGDANNDGSKEIVIGLYSGTNALRMYNYTGGVWVETNISTPAAAYSIAIGDANNDGSKEIVIGMDTGTNKLRIYNYTGGSWTETNISNTNTNSVYSVAIGDANNDGSNEIAIGMSAGNNRTRMYNYTGGSWVESNISHWAAAVNAVAIGDANNDGSNEIVIGMASTDNEVRMYNYTGGSWVETIINDTNVGVNSVAIGDANNDGNKDVVIGTSSSTKAIRIYENKSGGWIGTDINTLPSGIVLSVAIGDANNDGKNEVVGGVSATPKKLRMYENKSGGWIETNISDSPANVYSVVIGDANNDGKNEEVIGLGSIANETRMYNIASNPSSCGPMSMGQTCQLDWTVNATGTIGTQYFLDANFTSSVSSANDSGDFQINITAPSYGWLNVSYQSPTSGNSQKVYQNGTFNVSVNVTCIGGGGGGGGCGDVNGTLRYNNSAGLNPDTTVGNASASTPFAVLSTQSGGKENPNACGSMAAGQRCQLNWTVNATGVIGTNYSLDVNFTSSSVYVLANDSGNFQINIIHPLFVRSITTDRLYYINGTHSSMKVLVNMTGSQTELLDASLTRPDGSMISLGTMTHNSTSGFYESNYTLSPSADNQPGDYRINITYPNDKSLNYTSFLYMPVYGVNNIGVLTSRAQIWDAYRSESRTQIGFAMHQLLKKEGFLNSYLLSPKLVEDMDLSNFSVLIVSYLPSPLWTGNLTNKLRNFSNSGGLLVLFGNISSAMQTYVGVTYNKTDSPAALFNLTRNAIANSTMIAAPWLDTDYRWNTGVVEGGGSGMFSINMSAGNCEYSGGCTSYHSVNDWVLDLYNTSGANVLYNMTESNGAYKGVGIAINNTVLYSPLPLSDLFAEGASWAYNTTYIMLGEMNPYGNLFEVFSQILEYKLLQDDTYVRSWMFPEEAYNVVILRHDDTCGGYGTECAAINNSNMAHGMRGSTWIMVNNGLSSVQASVFLSEGNEIGYHVSGSLYDLSGDLIAMENTYNITIYTFSDHGSGSNDKGIDSLLTKETYTHGPNATIQRGYQVEGTNTISAGAGGNKQDPLFVWWNQTTRDVTLYPYLWVLAYDMSANGGNIFTDANPSGIYASNEVERLWYYRRNFPLVQLVHPQDVSTHMPAYDNFTAWLASWYRSNGNYTHKELADWYEKRNNVTFYTNSSDSNSISFVVNSPSYIGNFTWVVPWKSGWNETNVNITINGVDKTVASRIINASLYNASKDYLMFMTNVSAGQSTIIISKPPSGIYVTPISPANETMVDRDSVNASVADYVRLNISTDSGSTVNITFKANLTNPTIGGQTNLTIGYNTTSAGYAVFNWDPNISYYAGNYTWWGEANATYIINGTKTVLVYGGFNLSFQHDTINPGSSYVLGDNVTVNATLRSFGPESPLQLNSSYLASLNATIRKNSTDTALINLTYRETMAGNWSGNYTLKYNDPLSGDPYNVSLNATANYFFANTTNFTRSFDVLTNVTISITLYGIPVNYASLDPGITSNASILNGFPMIVSVDSITNVNVDVSIKSSETNMTGPGSNYILVQNQTFANNSVGTNSKSLNISYQSLRNNIPVNFTAGTNVSCYWWLTVPNYTSPGIYNNTIVVYSNQTG